jgi:PncC family amidohydrolase
MNKTALAIKNLLGKSGQTVSTAESITAGYLQTMLASVAGSSHVFKGGVTAYNLSAKVSILGVDSALAANHNCVHEEVARQMAHGALALFNSDYALATCGYAEPYPEQNIIRPFAFVAIARKLESGAIQQLTSTRLELSGNRIETQQQTANELLELFRKKLS